MSDDALKLALEDLTFASESMVWTRNERDSHILTALALGATHAQLAEAAHMSRQGIRQAIARMRVDNVDGNLDNSVVASVELDP